MALVMAQIHENDMKLKPYYQIHVADVVDRAGMDGKSAYKQSKQALDEMATQIWRIEDIEKEIYRPKQLVSTHNIEEKDGFEYGYKNGTITMVLNPALEPYFVQLAHYTKYELNHYMKFQSWYSMRMWELLSAWKDVLHKGDKWHCSLSEFRELMDCADKYPATKDLIQKTLHEPLEELNATELAFDFDKVFAKGVKGRPPVVGLEFYLKTPKGKKSYSAILEEWSLDDGRKRCIERGRSWKITDKNLVECLPIIKTNGAWELYKRFAMKEASNDRMEDVAKFCNAAILKEAGLK